LFSSWRVSSPSARRGPEEQLVTSLEILSRCALNADHRQLLFLCCWLLPDLTPVISEFRGACREKVHVHTHLKHMLITCERPCEQSHCTTCACAINARTRCTGNCFRSGNCFWSVTLRGQVIRPIRRCYVDGVGQRHELMTIMIARVRTTTRGGNPFVQAIRLLSRYYIRLRFVQLIVTADCCRDASVDARIEGIVRELSSVSSKNSLLSNVYKRTKHIYE